MLVSYLGTYDNGVIKLDQKPEGIKHGRVIITLLPEDEVEDNRIAMKLSESAFDEWNNDTDSIYDTL